MTARNRSKNSSNSNSSSDRAVASQQPEHDAPRKTPGKVAVKAESAPLASRGSGSDALTMMMKCVCALFSLALAAGVVLASMHFQRELSEIKHASVRYEESAMKCAAAAREVEHALAQIRSMQASLEGVESAVASARTQQESTSRALQKSEADARRVEEALPKLQKQLLRDLAESIRELKEERQRDVSSLEQRMSRSAEESTAGFNREILELRARLEEAEAPALLAQELASVSSAVANLNTASEVCAGNVAVLREQISSVGSELQTRNREVASLSEELGAVRTLVQSAVGSLREEVSAARAGIQAASDRLQGLSERQSQASAETQSLRDELKEELQERGHELEERLRAAEESRDAELNALETRQKTHEDSLAGCRTTEEALSAHLEEMRSRLGEIKTRVADLEELKTSVSDLGEFKARVVDLAELKTRVADLEEQNQEQETVRDEEPLKE